MNDSEKECERLASLFRYAQVGVCVNGVTHDINNLLGAIMAYSEIVLLDESLTDDSRRMLNEVLDAVSRCSTLITSITDIARPEKKVLSIIEPHKIIDKVLLIRSYAMKFSQIDCLHEAEEGIPSISADAPGIQMALLYLIFNAEQNAVLADKRCIQIRSHAAGDGVEIVIQDSGPPLPEEIRDRLFEPGVTTKETPHLGYGLCMARKIAEAHQGSLTWNPDRGFILFLPIDSSEK